MARVCEEWFPKGTYFKQKHDGFYMDNVLKEQIDVLIANIKKDWDFTIIITGNGEVRVGKSVLAMQIGAYWSYQMEKVHGIKVPFSVEENFVLNGPKLIETGNKLGQNNPYSCLIFDEAGADLEGRKIMQRSTQNVIDFYRECGQYNLLNILVLPEFFDLPKGIALSRSICLINTYYTANEEGIFERGFYDFYSRQSKKKLYLFGKRDLNYGAAKYDFHGRYMNFYPVDEKKYRELKQQALTKREGVSNVTEKKYKLQRDQAWSMLVEECGLSQEELVNRINKALKMRIARQTLSLAINKWKMEIPN